MFNEIPINTMNNGTQTQEQKQQDIFELQKQAYEDLEFHLSTCDTIDAVIIEVSDWQDRYHIIDIDTFFDGNDELASKVHQLIASKLDELRIKKEQEKALTEALAMVAQKKTFYRLYTILSEAKNDKDFERANEKLKDWLKDHPEKTWEQFSEQYQSYFKKVANEEHLKYITGKAKQDEIVFRLEEIYDHSVRYSDYAFFHENIALWESEYATRDQFLSAEQKEKIEALIKDGYEKLMPPEIEETQIAQFESPNGAFVYQSLAIAMSASSDKLKSSVDWLGQNSQLLCDLSANDKEKITGLLMDKFKINIIPNRFDYSVRTINEDTNIKNVELTTINYLLYKLNSADGITPDDIGIFMAASVKSDLAKIASNLEPTIEEQNPEKLSTVRPSNEELAIEEPTIKEQDTNELPTVKTSIEEQIIEETSTQEGFIDTHIEFTKQTLSEKTTTEEPITEVAISQLSDTFDNEPVQIAEETIPEEGTTLKLDAEIITEPILEETNLGEPIQPMSCEEILVEPVLEDTHTEEPIQAVSQEELVSDNTITPEHETIEDPERTHAVEAKTTTDTYQFETAGVPERIGDESVNTQTTLDTNEEENLTQEENNEPKTKSNPLARVAFWFSSKKPTTNDDVVSIEANDIEPTLSKKNREDKDLEHKRNF